MYETYSGAVSAAQERTILKNVFIWMTAGLLVTTVVGYFLFKTGLINAVVFNPILLFGCIIAEFALVIYLGRRISRMKANTAIGTFALYSALNGITLSAIVYRYTGETVITAFAVTALTFGAMALYGATTKRDLSKMGSFLLMALFGIIIAMVVNFFLGSSLLYLGISVAGVVVFTLLTAYDVKKIKAVSRYYTGSVTDDNYTRISIYGALTLYLDFINLFIFLLRILGIVRGRD